jgi:DNA-binding GntR family transcriptional regulator
MELGVSSEPYNKNGYLVDSAFNAIRDAILNNLLKPGAGLSEGDLAKQLGISRTPIREALKRLEEDGLVQIVPRKGAFVTEVTIEAIVEVFQLREALECYAVEFVPQYGDMDELTRLEVDIEQTARFVQENNREKLHEIDEDLHLFIARSARNDTLYKLNKRFLQLGSRFRFVSPTTLERFIEIESEHLAITRALKAGDIPTAKAALATHLRKSGNHVIQARLRLR